MKRWKEWGAIAGATTAILALMALVWAALGLDFPPWAAQARTMQMAQIIERLCNRADQSEQTNDFLSLGFFQDRYAAAEMRLRVAPDDVLAQQAKASADVQIQQINRRLNARAGRTSAGCGDAASN